jgi:hypothetical protein
VGIPLYRSLPFLASLRENCAVLAAEGDVEVIVSDRHGLDGTIDVLRAEWGHDSRFRFMKSDDGLSWVDHMNLLLREARGDYFRWMPHDDSFPAGCLAPLVRRLDRDPAAVLAYGPTLVIGPDGSRLPERDRLNSYPVRPGKAWRFRHSQDLFWKGTCSGAFKGLFHRQTVVEAGLFIRRTHELVHAERARLFGISLLGGGLAEEPASIYLKRFHPDSVHAQWRVRPRHTLSTTLTMCGYLRDFGPGPFKKWLAMRHHWVRAAKKIWRWKIRSRT